MRKLHICIFHRDGRGRGNPLRNTIFTLLYRGLRPVVPSLVVGLVYCNTDMGLYNTLLLVIVLLAKTATSDL
jgi:hypothetical protein